MATIESLLDELRQSGVRDEAVLAALRQVPREAFLPPELRPYAYQNTALPIGEDQTISQPLVVAVMTAALHIRPGDQLLEIGTGSGYQAAVLAAMGAQVLSLERIPRLAESAAHRLDALGYHQVRVQIADGAGGWPAEAPYDGIIVTAQAPTLPLALVGQLKVGRARLVVPIGPPDGQELIAIARVPDEPSGYRVVERLGPVKFVPLIGQG